MLKEVRLPGPEHLHYFQKFSVRRVSLYLLLVIFVAQFLLAPIVSASITPFTAHMLVDGDVEPPTIPAPIGATAVAEDQIDLVWGASTDNTTLLGYRVFRDGLQIATTTLTTFSDSGLMPQTTYTYFIDAFDAFYNYSSSSDSVTATTLEQYTQTPSTPATPGGSSQIINISSIVIIPEQFSARLEWTTNIPTSYIIRWGRTDSYEQGTVHGGQFQFEHTTVITDLELATRYFYEIESLGGMYVKRVITRGEFTTSGTIPDQAVANVLGLRAEVENDSVRLTWRNPAWDGFSHIRIVRSHLFYPQNATDGMVLYEGNRESYYDNDVFEKGLTWYYAIFVYDKNGRISSGATAMVNKDISQEVPVTPDFLGEVDLFAMNVALSQGSTTSYLHDPAPFSALEPLFVSIPITAVPRHLKSIIVNVTHPSRQNESSSYLLKINPDGNAYETLLPPALEAGQSRLTVTLYNYELATVRTVSNMIEFKMESRLPPLPAWMVALAPYWLLIIFLLFVLVLILSRWWLAQHPQNLPREYR